MLVRGGWGMVLAPGRTNGVEYAAGGDMGEVGRRSGSVQNRGCCGAATVQNPALCDAEDVQTRGSRVGEVYKSPVCAVRKTYKTGICCAPGQSEGCPVEPQASTA
jgi:hypothetical protein